MPEIVIETKPAPTKPEPHVTPVNVPEQVDASIELQIKVCSFFSLDS